MSLRVGVAAVGLALLTAGLYWVYPPAALIGPGALLFGLAVWPLLLPGKGD
jgi:hypothetical protein